MSLITTTTYTAITGATAPGNFEALQTRVISRLSLLLGRHLTSASRTETITAHADGYAYPKATPITACNGYTFDTHAISTGAGRYEVTYTGGWTTTTCPADLAEAVAWGIHTLATGGTGAAVSPGLTSLNIAGEYQVAVAAGKVIGRDGHPMPERFAFAADLGGRCISGALRYRRVLL